MPSHAAAPMVEKVLQSLSSQQLHKLAEHAESSTFHHGVSWFGPGRQPLACPMGVAFALSPDNSEGAWWGAKLDDKALAAFRHLLTTCGGEKGLDQYMLEMGSLTPEDLSGMIKRAKSKAS